MTLDTPVRELRKVGEKLEKKLAKLGIETARDLLWHFPFRHEDWRQTAAIGAVRSGMQTTVKGVVRLISARRTPRRRMMMTEAMIEDETGSIRAVWFNQPFIAKTLKQGQSVILSGVIKEDRFGLHMPSPAWERPGDKRNAGRIIPMYPLTAGVTQKQMRALVSQVLDGVKDIKEWLPGEILQKAGILGLSQALKAYHFPESTTALDKAESRLKFDELFLVQLLGQYNRALTSMQRALPVPFDQNSVKDFVDSLPFTLTPSQKRAAWDILKDCQKDQPMNRMLEGDVGSGKTVVCALAALNVVKAGLQVVVLAPTEVLASQHFTRLNTLLADQCSVGIITRVRKENSDGTSKPVDAQIIVGTHALLQSKVVFNKVGLIVVDEQHRFGVEQRRLLKEKSGIASLVPHFLSMTATPIPRSFALAAFGDLDISIIPELPPGRKPIKTRIVEPKLRSKAYDFVRQQVAKGRQVFVIAPLIEQSDKVGAKSAKELFEQLSKEFTSLRVGLLHGRLKAAEKEQVMKEFSGGEIDILVSTSVIEVGVDVPNASVMWIEGADRFGLAQLHQFRGRVGRSDHQSYCLVFSDGQGEKSKERLAYFEKELNGFKLAEHDLQMRGPGEVYGKAQSGMMHLKLANLHDSALIVRAQETAQWVFEQDHTMSRWPHMSEHFNAWRAKIHLE